MIWESIPYLKGMKVTKPELSKLFGYTINEIDTFVRNGCPHTRSGGVRSPLIFDTAEFTAWCCIRAAAEHSPQAAKIVRANIEKEALEAELERQGYQR